ncbi:MAG: TerB family tellurite resistance protein [Muribaculaceae bacterium]|jgi:uncharacterized tellurite resistance protein B-like protein|nr:TerB family tellurite resistance protein [Muribaculaceae bacterium]
MEQNTLPIEIIVKLAAKTGLYFACVDGDYDKSEQEFIARYLDRLAEVGDVSDVRYMIEHATDVPVSMDELVGETRRLLNSLPTPADRQAVTWALYRFIDKVIHVDGVVREPEREAFETWINSLLT